MTRLESTRKLLLSLLHGKASKAFGPARVRIHQHAHDNAVAVRRGPWKLILAIAVDHPVLSRSLQLYNLDDDPRRSESWRTSARKRWRSSQRLRNRG